MMESKCSKHSVSLKKFSTLNVNYVNYGHPLPIFGPNKRLMPSAHRHSLMTHIKIRLAKPDCCEAHDVVRVRLAKLDFRD